MGQPVIFGILIIILVFLPILTLQGMEGKMFQPLAYTIMIALVVSLAFSLTLSPVLCAMALNKGSEEDHLAVAVDQTRVPSHAELGHGTSPNGLD